MVDESALMRLALTAYEAAADHTQWSVLLDDLCEAFGATSSHLFTPGEADAHERFLWAHARADPAALIEFGRHWITEDPWWAEVKRRNLPLVSGTMLVSESYLPLERLKKTAFYNDFGARNGLQSVVTLWVEGGQPTALEPMTVMTMQRGPGLPGFTPAEVRGFQALHPHLHRALHSYWAFAAIRREHRAVEETLDAVPQPLLVLRANGTVEHANPPARALLATAGVIRVLGNHIQRIGQLDMATLAHALRMTSIGAAQTLSTWFDDKGRLRSAVLRLTPVPREHAVRNRWPAAEVLLLVDLVDAAEHCTTLLHALARHHQLTTAEASLLSQLVAGATLAEAAEHQQVRVSTMRTHMAHLLAKTGTRRQSDLMRLLS